MSDGLALNLLKKQTRGVDELKATFAQFATHPPASRTAERLLMTFDRLVAERRQEGLDPPEVLAAAKGAKGQSA